MRSIIIKPFSVAALGAGLSLVLEVLGNWLSVLVSGSTVFIIFLVVGAAIFGILYLYARYRQRTEVTIDAEALRGQDGSPKEPQKGLVVLLSLCRPLAGSAKSLMPAVLDKAIEDCDYVKLDLENTANTTLGHQILAIKTHSKTLRHCWLVATRARIPGKRQSLDFAPVVAKFIKEKISKDIQVHYGDDYAVTIDNEEAICRSSYRLIKKIYDEARRLGIKNEEMLTDVTGSIRGVSIGATLACLDRDTDIEYIGAEYDDNGNPTGNAFPLIVEYKPLPKQ